jgi:hypothetical protein
MILIENLKELFDCFLLLSSQDLWNDKSVNNCFEPIIKLSYLDFTLKVEMLLILFSWLLFDILR